jgi:hypothetical protein
MVEIVWHRRGNQTATEKTNINLKRSEKPVYSPQAGQKAQTFL